MTTENLSRISKNSANKGNLHKDIFMYKNQTKTWQFQELLEDSQDYRDEKALLKNPNLLMSEQNDTKIIQNFRNKNNLIRGGDNS